MNKINKGLPSLAPAQVQRGAKNRGVGGVAGQGMPFRDSIAQFLLVELTLEIVSWEQRKYPYTD